MSKISEQILALRAQGKTYNEIHSITGASKGLISYHCGQGQKEKSSARQAARKSDHIVRKLNAFKAPAKIATRLASEEISRRAYWKVLDFQRKIKGSGARAQTLNFTFQDVLSHFGTKTKCYLTGREIDLSDPRQYQFDHIIPSSRGGTDTLDNLGIVCPEANFAKGKLSVAEFVELCYDVIENFENNEGLV